MFASASFSRFVCLYLCLFLDFFLPLHIIIDASVMFCLLTLDLCWHVPVQFVSVCTSELWFCHFFFLSFVCLYPFIRPMPVSLSMCLYIRIYLCMSLRFLYASLFVYQLDCLLVSTSLRLCTVRCVYLHACECKVWFVCVSPPPGNIAQ